MNLGNDLIVSTGQLHHDTQQTVQRTSSWYQELKYLIQQMLANENAYQFLLNLLRFVKGWCGFCNYQESNVDADIAPDPHQLLDQLMQLAELLADQNQKQSLLLIVDETTSLLKYQTQSLIRRLRYRCMNYLMNCERNDSNKYMPVVSTRMGSANRDSYHFSLNLFQTGNSGKKVKINHSFIIIDKEERSLKLRSPENGLDTSKDNIVDMSLSSVRYTAFKDCYRIVSLDVSHTFIFHLDIRQLINLADLRLTNTHIKRMNLVSQRKLKFLYCSYTRVCYLSPFVRSQLRRLYLEFSGRLKLNALSKSCEVSISAKQTVDGYQCNVRIEAIKELYVISCPYSKGIGMGQEVKVILPKKCDEIVDKNIKLCCKLTVQGYMQDQDSEIDTFNIINYPNMQELTIERIKCKHFYLADLPSLTSIEISKIKIARILLQGFPSLEKIVMAGCDYLKQLGIQDCEKVVVLDVQATRISQLDISGLKELRKLAANKSNISQIDVSMNTKLEELNVSHTKIYELDITKLTELRMLNACNITITQIDLSKNVKLEELFIGGTKISMLDVSQLTDLAVLNASDITITQIDVSRCTKLRKLSIDDTKISELTVSQLAELEELSVYGTNLTQLDVSRNTKLRKLTVHDTQISQLDVRQLTELKELEAFNTSITHIDLSQNTNLEELIIHNTMISRLDAMQLEKLKNLQIYRTNIRQVDLLNNTKLISVLVSDSCRVLNCCCRFDIIN